MVRHFPSSSGSCADNAGSARLRPLMVRLSDCLHAENMSRCEIEDVLKQLDLSLQQYQLDVHADGPLHDALHRNPWLTTRVQQLRQQRGELQAMLRPLLELARNADDWAVCFPQLSYKFDQFVERCLDYDAAVQDMLHEAFPGPSWLQDPHGDLPFP